MRTAEYYGLTYLIAEGQKQMDQALMAERSMGQRIALWDVENFRDTPSA